MNQNFRLGEVDGIPVGANWSVVVIFFLFAWELAALILPDDHPHQGQAVYWVVALVTTALLFASLLAHEVSHAVVAKRNGIKVRQITLWLFGGVSELESEALTPAVDFRVAVVGPLTSILLGGFFGIFGLLFHRATGTAGVVASAIGWLAWINLFLGVFNLLPGAPLDGGRVLRASVWKRTGDRVRAASVAADAGETIGFILVALGVLEFITVSFFGLWFVFLGWFLLSAARAEKNDVVMRSSLTGIHVGDVMTRNPTTFASTTTVAELVDQQLPHFRFSTYPLVAPDGRLEGLATMARIRHVPPHLRQTTRLIDVACPMTEVPLGSPGEPIPDLLQRMHASPDGRALVLDADGRLVGIVSPSDIARLVQLSMLRSQGRGASKT
ncbi:MAG: site-2 protease family protein [Acidimicrobiales bacterium]|jgi:Zn-dependent protease